MAEVKLCECGCGKPAPIPNYTKRALGIFAGHPIRFIQGHHTRRVKQTTTHGRSGSPEHTAFLNAKNRCTNPKNVNWKDYGGRGITFEFTSFEQFFAELGPRPAGKSLDRIRNNEGYRPGNVRWATKAEQVANQRPKKRREA